MPTLKNSLASGKPWGGAFRFLPVLSAPIPLNAPPYTAQSPSGPPR
jgi:hypothetical protein